MLAKKFVAVRFAPGSARALGGLDTHDGPVVCCVNHQSWWDPLVMLSLHRMYLRGRTLRAPMDAAQLARFGFFRKLGTFGLDPDDPASLRAMSAYLGRYFDEDAAPTLWITPQGRFADVRAPLKIRPGAAAIAASDPRTRAVCVALEFPFLLDAKPEVWVRACPIEPADEQEGGRPSTTGWHRAIVRTMRENQAALAELVIARDPDAMTDIIGGSASNGNPLYDLYLRLTGRGGGLTDRTRASDAAGAGAS